MKRKLWRILQRLQYFGKFVKVSQADIIAKMGFVTKDTTNKLERERNGLTREVGMEREREREMVQWGTDGHMCQWITNSLQSQTWKRRTHNTRILQVLWVAGKKAFFYKLKKKTGKIQTYTEKIILVGFDDSILNDSQEKKRRKKTT